VSAKNITTLIQAIHEQETNKNILAEVRQELENGTPEELLDEVRFFVKKAESAKSNVVAFPSRTVPLGTTALMAASGQDLGEWFAQPIVFAANGFIVDIRKVLGSDNDVDVYIYPNSSDQRVIEKTLLPFKGKSLQVTLSINETDLLNADIYIDETGHAGEGTGHLSLVNPEEVHGKLSFEVIVEE
jgi:hypothetical protein